MPSASHSSPKDGQVVFGWGKVDCIGLCFGCRSSLGSLDDIFQAAFCEDVSGCLRPRELRDIGSATFAGYVRIPLFLPSFFFLFVIYTWASSAALRPSLAMIRVAFFPRFASQRGENKTGGRYFSPPIDGDEPSPFDSESWDGERFGSSCSSYLEPPDGGKRQTSPLLPKFTEMIQVLSHCRFLSDSPWMENRSSFRGSLFESPPTRSSTGVSHTRSTPGSLLELSGSSVVSPGMDLGTTSTAVTTKNIYTMEPERLHHGLKSRPSSCVAVAAITSSTST